jgi:hypothetical protein
MRYVTDPEIGQMVEAEKTEWESYSLSHHLERYQELRDVEWPFMFQCLRCKAHFMLDECANCGNKAFKIGEGGSGAGIFCKVCEKGFSTWHCSKCEAENPASKTFFRLHKIVKQGGCFIATAAYGTEDAPEVVSLIHFRDSVLLNSKLGRYFIRLYYAISPPIAQLISKSLILRKIVRKAFIRPIASLYRSFQRQSESRARKVR